MHTPLNKLLLKTILTSFIYIILASSGHAKTAPAFTLPTANKSISLSQFQGKVVYLDFWASWCTSCRKSFPWMNKMQERYGKKGLVIVAVNLDKDKAQLDKFLKKYPTNFIIAEDPSGSIAARYKVPGMPSAYLISRKGEITSYHIGFREKDKAKLEEKIKSLLSL